MIKKKAYDGDKEVRGITCESYKSCQYDEIAKTNYTVTHFFTSKMINFFTKLLG